ncbi:pickpocket protein 28-like [Lycorma delicatula]|uniref:pickpocket protein 28-like n=1 Tax=Lycorma delicatula TaxID=130591 RepID=UPI003F51348C
MHNSNMKTIPVNNHIKRQPYYGNYVRRKSLASHGNLSASSLAGLAATGTAATIHKGYWEIFNMYFKSYCNVTTLHGFRYFAEVGRPFHERLYWIIAVVLVCVGMVFAIKSQILAYINNPILMSLNGKMVPVLDVPFPAITFCSDNQIPLSIFNISDLFMKYQMGNLTKYESDSLHIAALLCQDSNDKVLNLYDTEEKFRTVNTDFLMIQLKTCNKIFKRLTWCNVEEDNPCELIQFSSVIMGVCHSFNLMPPFGFYSKAVIDDFISSMPVEFKRNYPYKHIMSTADWSPDTGYVKKIGNPFQVLPFRVPGANFANTASFLLDFGTDEIQEFCTPKSNGFVAIVHNPSELPSFQHAVLYLEVDKRTVLHITPNLIETDSALRSWDPEDRGCYYGHERKLLFFDIYTYKNCELECEANLTLKNCYCNTIYQPRFYRTPICGKKNIGCILKSIMASSSDTSHREALFSTCGCLPGCNELSYDVEVISQHQNWTHNTQLFNIEDNDIKLNTYTIVESFFRSRQVNSIVRVGVLSNSDFIGKEISLSS